MSGSAATGLYGEADFDKSLLPTWVTKDLREVFVAAVALGWRVHISSSQSVTLVSHDERKKYHFNVGRRSTTPINRIRRDLVKFAEPSKVLLASEIYEDKGPAVDHLVGGLLPHFGDEGTVIDHRPDEQAAHEERERRRQEAIAAARRVAESRPSQVAADVSTRNPPLHIVTVKPMRASAGEGRAYDSYVTEERLWSDGHKDYKCQRCEYTSEDRNGVAAHSARKHGRVTTTPPPKYLADVPDAKHYRPRQGRVDALAERLSRLLTEGFTPTEENIKALAVEALTWAREQTRLGSALSEDNEPRSAEETLARIRLLIDDGTAMTLRTQVTDLETLVLDAEERVEQAQARAAAAEQRADQARSTLRAFMDLARDLDPEDDQNERAV